MAFPSPNRTKHRPLTTCTRQKEMAIIALIFFWFFSFIKKMFTTMHIGIGYPLKLMGGDLSLLFFIAIMFVFEWLMRDRLFPLRFEDKVKRPFRWIIYIFLTLLIIWFHGKEAEFIYFQF